MLIYKILYIFFNELVFVDKKKFIYIKKHCNLNFKLNL